MCGVDGRAARTTFKVEEEKKPRGSERQNFSSFLTNCLFHAGGLGCVPGTGWPLRKRWGLRHTLAGGPGGQRLEVEVSPAHAQIISRHLHQVVLELLWTGSTPGPLNSPFWSLKLCCCHCSCYTDRLQFEKSSECENPRQGRGVHRGGGVPPMWCSRGRWAVGCVLGAQGGGGAGAHPGWRATSRRISRYGSQDVGWSSKRVGGGGKWWTRLLSGPVSRGWGPLPAREPSPSPASPDWAVWSEAGSVAGWSGWVQRLTVGPASRVQVWPQGHVGRPAPSLVSVGDCGAPYPGRGSISMDPSARRGAGVRPTALPLTAPHHRWGLQAGTDG